MTEKTRLLKSAIDEIDRVLLGNKSADVNEVYLNNAKRFISESMQDPQPTFAVGEYYATTRGEIIYLITDILSDHKAYSKALLVDRLSNEFIKSDGIIFKDSKPATAEQIATFKRAEHFASKGRKLDEFRVGDKVMISDDKVIAGPLYVDGFEDGYVVIALNGGCYYDPDYPGLTLIQTAEGLQEVEREI